MQRRVVLKLIAAGVLAPRLDQNQTGLVALAASKTPYKLQFFSPKQNEMVDRLSEIILPADDHSPGAHEAKVSLYMDVMLSEADAQVQQQWSAGMKAVDTEAQRRFQNPFSECSEDQQDAIVAGMARNEQTPANELERFFAPLKRMTIDGYYTSEVGIHKDLRYKGNTAVSEFRGCTHAAHKG